ncbi:unnamed protein product [Hyaloperonospora brassicae]|uniref:Pre-mRNA-splicing factor SPF27 n=1 Tax=Hyaloperonospora brassicae TaxID=162125 RepID=A0AAV0USB4_HYABA|nr:unnamed protein product [Hyaloperonospora brassicae]
MAPSTCPLLASSRALIDSLGYIDTEYNSPSSQQQVQAQIRAEMATFAPPDDKYLSFLPYSSSSSSSSLPSFSGHRRLQTEFKRVMANVPLDAIDMNRYQVREPTGKHMASLEAWEQALKQLQVAVEHETTRVLNLELYQSFGTPLLKVRAALLDGMKQRYAHVVRQTKLGSDKVNRARQDAQARNSVKLHKYQRSHNELLEKNASIKRACAENEKQTQQKKTKVEIETA